MAHPRGVGRSRPPPLMGQPIRGLLTRLGVINHAQCRSQTLASLGWNRLPHPQAGDSPRRPGDVPVFMGRLARCGAFQSPLRRLTLLQTRSARRRRLRGAVVASRRVFPGWTGGPGRIGWCDVMGIKYRYPVTVAALLPGFRGDSSD